MRETTEQWLARYMIEYYAVTVDTQRPQKYLLLIDFIMAAELTFGYIFIGTCTLKRPAARMMVVLPRKSAYFTYNKRYRQGGQQI